MALDKKFEEAVEEYSREFLPRHAKYLAEKSPRWRTLLDCAREQGVSGAEVVEALFDAGLGVSLSDKHYPFHRVARIVEDVEDERLPGWQKTVVEMAYGDIKADIERWEEAKIRPEELAREKQALSLLEKIYPDLLKKR